MFVPAMVLALAALASAAPHYDYRRSNLEGYFSDEEVFDSRKFWKDLNDRFMILDEVFEGLSKRFPQKVSTQGVEGNTYVVTVPLEGFEEKDISVKARQGLLMIEATHKYADIAEKIYVDIRVLPSDVDPVGKWTFVEEVLKIKFPLQGKVTTEQTTTAVTTEGLPHSREEMEPHADSDNLDADVGVERFNSERELLTNEIESGNPVEATTHISNINRETEWVN